ncbi:heterokaryon incompatibility protein-domain-containing protein [Thelonectria olida]|uniref:Heterokaryon incompatibility protein-domain-containing protein n=1 Tax=Thelonectria olida TaxID=1576542 RepID=A0A9P8W1R8_9HYPO|nr:heterokaryon incompatibility protein-domain-containing protein [Thelonectria olida]
MGLCQYCSNIPAKLFSFRRNDQCDYDHQPNLPALQASATTGCQGCCLFLHAIESSASEHAGKYALGRTWSMEERVHLSSTKFGWQVVRVGWKEAGHFRTYAIPSEWRSERPPDSATGEDASAYLSYESQLIQRWSKLCLADHQSCSRGTGFLPTRLIDVGTAAEPKLSLVSSAKIGHAGNLYLALSHCWGLAMPASGKTTSQTLEAHESSISMGDLPPTFQDFIEIARRLKVRYVWIDSLCIIQNSRQDWEKEAAQMASVYSNAYLTISASGSADGRGGCRVADNVRSCGPVDIECQSNSASSSREDSITVFRLWSRDTYPIGQILGSDPLTKRGWTLQERELSPRVVHYSKDTIRWECCELRATIEFPWGDFGSFDVGRLFDGGSSSRPTQIGLPINDSKPIDEVTKQRLSWFELVDRYTSRSLTKQTDILPAFSGIARSIAESTSDEYYAGLWRSYFAHCLLWASKWHVSRPFTTHSRPSNYLAPSWSWASVKGPVQYLSWINGYWHSFNTNPDPAYAPKLIDVSLQTSLDPYGMVKSGALRIQGRVAMAFSKQETYATPKDHLAVTFTPGPQDRLTLYGPSATGTLEEVGEIRYDVPLCYHCAPVGSMRLFWLLCCMNSEKSADGKMRTFAIALQGEDCDDTHMLSTTIPTRFRRVGIAWGIDSSFWERGLTSTLTIV